MPRSIQQLKHRLIQFDNITEEQLANAVRVLERLPGVTAIADLQRNAVSIDYWVDEYTLSDLEAELASRNYPLEASIHVRIQRAEIHRDEENERDALETRSPACRSAGVFARTYHPHQDGYEALSHCI